MRSGGVVSGVRFLDEQVRTCQHCCWGSTLSRGWTDRCGCISRDCAKDDEFFVFRRRSYGADLSSIGPATTAREHTEFSPVNEANVRSTPERFAYLANSAGCGGPLGGFIGGLSRFFAKFAKPRCGYLHAFAPVLESRPACPVDATGTDWPFPHRGRLSASRCFALQAKVISEIDQDAIGRSRLSAFIRTH